MTDYISREDAERALLERCKETGYGGLTPDDIRLVMRTPWRIPTADVVEVVRCKDCSHSLKGKESLECEKHRYVWNDLNRRVDDEDFCCWGVKRGEDDV